MDMALLAKSAEKLETLLRHYAVTDTEASGLLDALAALISDARAGKISAPLEWSMIPGARSFSEGGLRKYDDLETAFADFRIEATGGESPVLRNLRLRSNAP
jgi:hypothetical protein